MKKLNELQYCLTKLRGFVVLVLLLFTIGIGNVWGKESEVAYAFPSCEWWTEHIIEIILGTILSGMVIYHILVKIEKKYNNKNNLKQGNDAQSEIFAPQGEGNTLQNNNSPKTNAHQEGTNNSQNITYLLGDIYNYYGDSNEGTGTHIDKQKKSEKKTANSSKFDFYNCSKIGVAILYAAYLSHKQGTPFPVNICGNPNYVHGFLVGVEVTHPHELRFIPLNAAQAVIHITLYSHSFFDGVTEAAQMAKRTDVKPIIEQIERYFSVK